jgi:hypothetical protein
MRARNITSTAIVTILRPGKQFIAGDLLSAGADDKRVAAVYAVWRLKATNWRRS